MEIFVYFSSLFNAPVLPIAWALIIILSIVNYTGIKQSSRLNTVLAAVEILGLLIVIGLGNELPWTASLRRVVLKVLMIIHIKSFGISGFFKSFVRF